MRSTLIVFACFVGACQVNAEAKTGGSSGSSASMNVDSNESFSASAPPTTQTATPPQTPPVAATPTAPPSDACPLSCYVASGAAHALVSDQEAVTIRSGLEPTLSAMRACTSPESWRRHGSPVLNLRVAADGQVNEVDVDPHHRYDSERSCMDGASRSAVTLSLPGRHVVRCSERCVQPRTITTQRRRR